MGAETKKCIVLNSTYEPLTIVTVKRAISLIVQGKAIPDWYLNDRLR